MTGPPSPNPKKSLTLRYGTTDRSQSFSGLGQTGVERA
jgi:hypothetical protein